MYKGIHIPEKLADVVSHMKSLEETRESLSVLGQQWDLLSILGKMSNTGTDMTQTREGFKDLTSDLIGTLGIETLKKSVLSITSKAQVTVDIVIRNLFERTADIGFLATDDDLRKFLLGAEEVSEQMVKARFAEYVAKYSVYDNIILMDPTGAVRCQLREDNPITLSKDKLIQEALTTKGGYVETYGWSDLNARDEQSLNYSFRVSESNAPNASVIGVLCLVFRFENELEGIFKNLISEGDWTVLTLLDKDGVVLASSDRSQVPLHSKISISADSEFKVTRFGGRLYLAKTCRTKGYQGYMGLGWYGHAMLPLELAFESNESDKGDQVDPEVLEALTESPRLFSDELRKIPKNAETIQSELDRTVWNGNVVMRDQAGENSKANERKVLLWEISSTGSRTKAVFEDSIKALHRTVISSILSDAAFVSFLAIDIMDRNLYERANDCRWWALTTAFRESLAQPTLSGDDQKSLTDILKYINGLYTVYTNLILFDRNAKVIGVSNASQNHLVGQTLNEGYVKEILSTRAHDRYTVSSFEASQLYGGEYTYIYGAPIRSIQDEQQVIGGIAIVFDGKPQFRAMLEDSLPRTEKGEIPEGCFSVFTDRQKRIVSTTSSSDKVGELLDLPDEIFSFKCGTGTSKIIEFRGRYYSLGVRVSQGYREYKGPNDSYKNDIFSLTFIPLGNVEKNRVKVDPGLAHELRISHRVKVPGVEYKELATFIIGENWLGLETDSVVEAIIANEITPIPGFSEGLAGTVLYKNQPIAVLKPHMAFNALYTKTSGHLIVVIRSEKTLVGVMVDRLGEIPEVEVTKIHKNPGFSSEGSGYIEAIVNPRESAQQKGPMLILVNPTRFVKIILEKTGAGHETIVAELRKLGGTSSNEYDEENTLGVLSSLKGSS